MKKSNFAAMILGTVSGVLFALGMCMTLLSQWDAFRPGVILGCIGLCLGFVTVWIWRRMEHKAPLRITGKRIAAVITGATGALALGAGICFSMVWNQMVCGIVVGLMGLLILLGLIPLVKGLR